MAHRTAIERYWAFVDTSGGPDACWLWTGGCGTRGYGMFWIGSRYIGAHRWGYLTFVGPLALGQIVRHTCDNPPCQNPRHWLPGTHQDNCDDRISRGRSNTLRGSLAASAKLTESQALDIRARYAAGGITQQTLGEEYGVTGQHISHSVTRKSWTHI